MFAGPNGSGKSVLKSYLPAELLGVYLNPDEIEAGFEQAGGLDPASLGVETTSEEVLSFFLASKFLRDRCLDGQARALTFAGSKLQLPKGTRNSYFASVMTDFLRMKLLEKQATFTFETVMSHPSKVELLGQAQKSGYRTYPYYVATDDPAINISRVQNRVRLQGHDVPSELIVSRYHRSLELLMSAIRLTHRAYIFDNSTDNPDQRHTWVAEVTNGRTLELKGDRIPAWFKRAVLDKVSS